MTMQPYAGSGYQVAVAPQTDRKFGNTGETVCAWVLAVLTLGYLFPWAVAASRGKSNSAAIALVNLFAGWSVIGWVVALVMACGAHQPAVTLAATAAAAPAGWYPDPQGAGVQRYWDGQRWTEHVEPTS
jgi:hypothetical protein